MTEGLLGLADEPDSPVSYLRAAEYEPAICAWASAEAACQLFRAWFSERGLFDSDSEPVKGMQNWDRAEARATKLRQRLGLDPLSRARLGRDVGAATVDLAVLLSQRADDDD